LQALRQQREAETAKANDLQAQIARGRQDLASLSEDQERARQELQSVSQQRQSEAAAASDLRAGIARGRQEMAALTADRDRARQDLEALGKQRQAQATAVAPSRIVVGAAKDATAGGAPREEAAEPPARVTRGRQELASLSAAEDRARQELLALGRQRSEAAAPIQSAVPPPPSPTMTLGPTQGATEAVGAPVHATRSASHRRIRVAHAAGRSRNRDMGGDADSGPGRSFSMPGMY
jgi:hypothetical protein